MSAVRELWSADYLCWKLGHFKNHLSERKNEKCVGKQIPRQFHTTSLITSLFLGVMTTDHWAYLLLCVANHEKHCSKAKARAWRRDCLKFVISRRGENLFLAN